MRFGFGPHGAEDSLCPSQALFEAGEVKRLSGLREHGEIIALKLSELFVESLEGFALPPVPNDSAQLDKQNVHVVAPVPSFAQGDGLAFRESRQRAYRARQLAALRYTGATDEDRYNGGPAAKRRLDFVSEDVPPLGQPRISEPVGSDQHENRVRCRQSPSDLPRPGLSGGNVIDIPPDQTSTEAEDQ